MKVKSDIPLFNQGSEAVGGIYIVKLAVEDAGYHSAKMEAHRDDFFIFFVLTSGKVIMQCDTVDVEISATSMSFIKPFQIHAVKQVSADAKGYFISIASFLIPNACSEVFYKVEIAKQGVKMEDSLREDFLQHISLLHHYFNTQQPNKTHIINSLFNAFVYSFSNLLQSSDTPSTGFKNQSALISAHFKKLMHEHHFLESPSFFAKKLNISTSHLNDCVSAATGKSVTYWLQNAMMIEAQRLLYYTDQDVKEIAYELGFGDHSYFSRLFKKIGKETPLAFRKKFRE